MKAMSTPTPLVCKHLEPKMQARQRMDKVVIENYYNMTSLDENVNLPR